MAEHTLKNEKHVGENMQVFPFAWNWLVLLRRRSWDKPFQCNLGPDPLLLVTKNCWSSAKKKRTFWVQMVDHPEIFGFVIEYVILFPSIEP